MSDMPPNRWMGLRACIGAMVMTVGIFGASASMAGMISTTPGAAEDVAAPAPAPAPRNPRLPYAVGDRLEARVGDTWIPAQVHAITKIRTPRGMQIGYGVTLANGKKAIVSTNLLRKPSAR